MLRRLSLILLLFLVGSSFTEIQPRYIYRKIVAPHNDRVRLDAGTPTNHVLDAIALARDNEMYGSDLKLAFNPYLTGTKLRAAAPYNFATKGYDMSAVKNDLTQTTAANQPYFHKIAPDEKPSLMNPNGDDTYMTHPTISFGASDAWTVECVVNSNNSAESTVISLFGNGLSSATSMFVIKTAGANLFKFYNSLSVGVGGGVSTNFIYGKINVITLCALGNNTLSIYVNGIFKETLNVATNIDISKLGGGTSITNSWLQGKLYHYSIFSKALSASEVANRSALLKNMFPEIESVTIGSQTWAVRNYDAVCTPQGNLIPEMKAATNTEKIVNGGFDTDTGWIKGAGWTISGGVATITNNTSSIYQSFGANISKYYKVTVTVSGYSGEGVSIADNNGTLGTIMNSNGTFTQYIKPSTATAFISFYAISGSTLSIDNVSVQEVGWSDSQNLYDYIYANTSGTVEQKTYAAVKAAAMWCHYNNDPALAIWGSKLYNKFAAKLLAMDIAYYSIANPTTPWGWDVSNQSDQTTLQNYLGDGDADKLKHLGTTYWTSGTGTNTTGFTALPAGYIDETGTFRDLNLIYIIIDTDITNQPMIGGSIRLIKR